MIFFQRDVFLPFQLFLLFDLLIWCWTTIFLNSSGGQKILLAIRLKYGEEIGDKAMCVLQDGNLIPCWDSVWHSSITDLELRWVQKTAVSSVWEQENEVYLDVPAETTVEHSETEPTTWCTALYEVLILIQRVSNTFGKGENVVKSTQATVTKWLLRISEW